MADAKQSNIDLGRADLLAWEESKPKDFFEGDSNIQSVLRMHLGDAFDKHRATLAEAGRIAGDPELDQLVRLSNRDENLPRLARYSGLGSRTEEIVFHPSYHEVGRRFWKTGVLAVTGELGNDVLAGGLAYFLDQHGEAGHACPVACTGGLIKLLQQVGTRDQQQRFLPPLLERDYELRLHASQFVTEVQGGSDVGANAVVARPDGQKPGIYRITGEKWFCSVIDAQAFVVSARPEGAPDGTRGLGLFLVPRVVDGEPNHFTVRRLKYKLGTRSMASAEVDFDGAYAEPLGEVDKGFKNLVSIVLDTSRVHNALAACGMMRRAFVEAQTFARHRRAFGVAIIEHPMVQQILARMRVATHAAVATTFRILAMNDRLAAGDGGGDLARARRVQVNVNKFFTAIWSTRVVRDGIEVLGGNGAIEEFSVLPRLYRDAIVIESWEGTHNTLCAQILRDFATRGLHRPYLGELRSTIEGVQSESLGGQKEYAEQLHGELTKRIGKLLASDARSASLHIRHVVERMGLVGSYVALLRELDWEQQQGIESDKTDQLAYYRSAVIEQRDPMQETGLVEQLQAISAKI
jgi:acyl-CoA dehydrogenase